MRALNTIFYGALAFLALGLPLWVSVAAFFTARSAGAVHPLRAAAVAGLVLLAALPIWLVGQALTASARYKKAAKPQAAAGNNAAPPLPGSEYSQLIDIWKKSVEVQQHFNELELQIRNFAVTLLVAVLGATAFALKEHYVITVFNINMSLAAGVCLAGIPGWLGFYFMDRHWYHRLLVGSVKQTVVIENRLKDTIPEIGLSKAIGDASPWNLGPFEIHSSEKIDIFYSVGLSVFIALTCLLLLLGTGSTEVPKTDAVKDSGFAAPAVVPDVKEPTNKQPTPPNTSANSSRAQKKAGRK